MATSNRPAIRWRGLCRSSCLYRRSCPAHSRRKHRRVEFFEVRRTTDLDWSQHLGELRGHGPKSDPTVTDLVLLLRGHLRGGPAAPLGDEHRVVSETVLTTAFPNQPAAHDPFGDGLDPVRHDKSHRTHELGPTSFGRGVGELIQEKVQVGPVLVVAAETSGPSGGKDPGHPFELVHG